MTFLSTCAWAFARDGDIATPEVPEKLKGPGEIWGFPKLRVPFWGSQ